jgi:signal transduction histidine kinase
VTQTSSHLFTRLHRPVLILSLLGFLIFGLTSYFVVNALVESSFVRQANVTTDIFTNSIRDDVLNGIESEVYRKCQSVLRNTLVVGILTKGLDDREICRTLPKDQRGLLLLERSIYFTPGKPDVAGEVRVYYRNTLAQSILIRIGLLFLGTLLVLILGYWLLSRRMIRKETSQFTQLATLLSESNIDKLEVCSTFFGDNESFELVELYSGVEKLSKNWRSYQNELLRTERLKAMNKASQLLAHDIKSPLGALISVSESFEAKPELSKKLLDKAIDRIDKMLKDIVGMTEQSSLVAQLRKENISDFFKTIKSDTIALYQRKKNLHFIFKESIEDDITLMLDINLLERAIGNLVKNAVEEFKDSQGSIECRLFREDRSIIISITDNGSGLPQAVLESIGSGQLTSTKKEGSGLGLFQVSKTMEDHGGLLKVTSSIHGTEFRLVFPV